MKCHYSGSKRAKTFDKKHFLCFGKNIFHFHHEHTKCLRCKFQLWNCFWWWNNFYRFALNSIHRQVNYRISFNTFCPLSLLKGLSIKIFWRSFLENNFKGFWGWKICFSFAENLRKVFWGFLTMENFFSLSFVGFSLEPFFFGNLKRFQLEKQTRWMLPVV